MEQPGAQEDVDAQAMYTSINGMWGRRGGVFQIGNGVLWDYYKSGQRQLLLSILFTSINGDGTPHPWACHQCATEKPPDPQRAHTEYVEPFTCLE